jgi:hypothetical protein
MAKTKGQNTNPTTSLGSPTAGIRPTEPVTLMSVPEGCLCSWDMHGERREDGGYTGLYWFCLKFRYADCPQKRAGNHG